MTEPHTDERTQDLNVAGWASARDRKIHLRVEDWVITVSNDLNYSSLRIEGAQQLRAVLDVLRRAEKRLDGGRPGPTF